jgi:lysophospholipase L1-like esterase
VNPATIRRTARKIAVGLAIALALAVVLLEIGSRIVDGVIDRRKAADPAYRLDPAKPRDLSEKLAFATLDPAAQRLADARTIPHPYLAYALKPSWRTPPGSVPQTSHNSLGFRGKETKWEKPAGVFRIVTSGGSSVYGQSESNDAAVWSQRLEDHLNEAGLAVRFEVVNGGCSGYNVFESLILYETRLADLHPDLVIQYEAINDMRCALYTRGGPVRGDNAHWREPWPVDRPSYIEKLCEKSRAYLVWRRYCTDYVGLRADLGHWAIVNYDPSGDPYDPEPVPSEGFDSYHRNLVSLVAAVRAHGSEILLVTQPLARWHLDGAPSKEKQLAGIDRIQTIEKQVAKDRDVALFDLAKLVEPMVQKELEREIAHQKELDPNAWAQDLERRAKEALHPTPLPVTRDGVIFRAEVHPYDYGSDLIAKAIANYLLKSDLVPKAKK